MLNRHPAYTDAKSEQHDDRRAEIKAEVWDFLRRTPRPITGRVLEARH